MVSDREVLEAARTLIDEVAVGCLATVDAEGRPFIRYMGLVYRNDELGWLYSLSAHATHKIDHLAHNPSVCWLVADQSFKNVLTIHGRATLEPTAELPASVYARLVEFAQPYAVNLLTDQRHHHFDVIVTQVQSISLLSPERGLTAPHEIEMG